MSLSELLKRKEDYWRVKMEEDESKLSCLCNGVFRVIAFVVVDDETR